MKNAGNIIMGMLVKERFHVHFVMKKKFLSVQRIGPSKCARIAIAQSFIGGKISTSLLAV